MMDMIGVVCCYNNVRQLEEMLLPSLEQQQNVRYKFFGIDNCKGKYKSAASAYNSIMSKVVVEEPDINYVVFAHQDIFFGEGVLLNISNQLAENGNSIVGFAGIESDGIVYSNLRYKKDDSYITVNHLQNVEKALSLDECCFATSVDIWQRVKFDEKVCNGWHLYGVDFCYAARCYFNVDVYILPFTVYHKEDDSSGLYVDNSYLMTIFRLLMKYRKITNCIYAPCYKLSKKNVLYRLLRSYIGNIIKSRR